MKLAGSWKNKNYFKHVNLQKKKTKLNCGSTHNEVCPAQPIRGYLPVLPAWQTRLKISYLAAVEHQLRLAQVADAVSLTHVRLGPVQ